MGQNTTEPVIQFAEKKAERKRRAYADLVLTAYDDLEHVERREQKQRAADVNAKAREQL